MIRTESGVRR